MAKKPLYIQLEPGAYPQDTDWQIMTAEERGCYHSLITFIACNDGHISKDPNGLALLCNINIGKLKTFLEKYSHKFVISDKEISHKRVNDELAKARKFIKQKSLAGKKGMQHRYNTVITPVPNTVITKESKVKESKGKERKGNGKDFKGPLDFTADGSFSFKKLFTETFQPETTYERNTLNKLAKEYGEAHKGLKHAGGYMIDKIADLKEMCKTQGKNRTDFIKIFVSQVKKEMK